MKDSVELELRGERSDQNKQAMAIGTVVTVSSAAIGFLVSGWPGIVIGAVFCLVFSLLGSPTRTKFHETRQIRVS